MNTWRAKGQRRGGSAVRGNQNLPQAPVGLTDAEVRGSLAQMAHAITMQAQAMTTQVNRQDVQRENPLVCNMDDRLRDFTRINPPIFKGSKTSEDPHEFVYALHKIT